VLLSDYAVVYRVCADATIIIQRRKLRAIQLYGGRRQ
jgi:hypothetical protein